MFLALKMPFSCDGDTRQALSIFKCPANKQVKETHHAMDRTVTTACTILFYLYIQIKEYIRIVR